MNASDEWMAVGPFVRMHMCELFNFNCTGAATTVEQRGSVNDSCFPSQLLLMSNRLCSIFFSLQPVK